MSRPAGPAGAANRAALPPASPASNPGDAVDASTPRRVVAVLLRLMRSKLVRAAFLILVLALLAVALYDQAGTLWHQVQRLSWPVVLLAFVFGLLGLYFNLMVWRELLADLGTRLSIPEAWRIYFIGGLSKDVPGRIWPLLAQAELGAHRGIPPGRSALSVGLSYSGMTCLGFVVGAITLPFATAAS